MAFIIYLKRTGGGVSSEEGVGLRGRGDSAEKKKIFEVLPIMEDALTLSFAWE